MRLLKKQIGCAGTVAAQTKFCGLQVKPQEQVSDFKKARACPGLLCSQWSTARSVIHATHSAHAVSFPKVVSARTGDAVRTRWEWRRLRQMAGPFDI